MKNKQLKTIAKPASDSAPHNMPKSPPIKALEELFDLLEDYGPAWYTEAHHERTLAALNSARQSAA